MDNKFLKTKAWPNGRQWPANLVLDCGSSMPTDVYGIDNPAGFGVLYVRHDIVTELYEFMEEGVEVMKLLMVGYDRIKRENEALTVQIKTKNDGIMAALDICKGHGDKQPTLYNVQESLESILVK